MPGDKISVDERFVREEIEKACEENAVNRILEDWRKEINGEENEVERAWEELQEKMEGKIHEFEEELVDEALENLHEHGVEVDKPSVVNVYRDLPHETEGFFQSQVQLYGMPIEIDFENGIYDRLYDRLEVYVSRGMAEAVNRLYKDELEELNEELLKNLEIFREDIHDNRRRRQRLDLHEDLNEDFVKAFQRISERLKKCDDDDIPSDLELPVNYERSQKQKESYNKIKESKILYKVALCEETDLNKDLKDDIEELMEGVLLRDIEHELVHAYHYQNRLEDTKLSERSDEIWGGFEKYIREVKSVFGSSYELSTGSDSDGGGIMEKVIKAGPYDKKTLALAEAINFLGEEEYNHLLNVCRKKQEEIDEELEEEYEKYRKTREELKQSLLNDLGKTDVSPTQEYYYDGIFLFAPFREDPIEYHKAEIKNDSSSEDKEEILEELENEKFEEYVRKVQDAYEDYKQRTKRMQIRDASMLKIVENKIFEKAIEKEGFEELLYAHEEDFVKRSRENVDKKLPPEFREGFAQFWSAYRMGYGINKEYFSDVLERYKNLENMDAEKLDKTKKDLIKWYEAMDPGEEEPDNMENVPEITNYTILPEERITEIMSKQFEYLDMNKEFYEENGPSN